MNRTKIHMAGAVLASWYFLRCAWYPKEWHFIDNVNLIFHEAGHTIFFFLGEFVQVAMGSGLQVLLPLSIALYFFLHMQRFSAAVSLMWVGQNLINISVYAGDSIAMQLPLLGGDSVIHDWNYLLTTLNVLDWTPQIAGAMYGVGVLTIGIGIIFSFLFAQERE